jgi:3-oxoacyl-[acyl-carrier-protein] synthase II
VPALIASSVVRTCFGDGRRTFDALLTGRCGLTPLQRPGPVRHGYQVADDDQPFRAGRWLSLCVAEALHEAGVDPADTRVAALVGTGLRELRSVERWAGPPTEFPLARLHFRPAVRTAAAEIAEVLTVSNACSAAGHALALAQDMLDLGDADAVVVGGADEMSDSMLAMIGRVADEAADAVRPFDTHRLSCSYRRGAPPPRWPACWPRACRATPTMRQHLRRLASVPRSLTRTHVPIETPSASISLWRTEPERL